MSKPSKNLVQDEYKTSDEIIGSMLEEILISLHHLAHNLLKLKKKGDFDLKNFLSYF